MERLRCWAAALKRDVLALWLAAKAPDVPWVAKAVAGLVAAYALSPIDLIPDVIPVLGLLDDLILVPAGIALAVRLIPADVMARLRAEADVLAERPASRGAAALIVVLWVGAAALIAWWFWPSQP